MNCRLITLKIETVNAAFENHIRVEIARILREVASRLEDDVDSPPFYLRDSNGNLVGELTIK